MATELFISIKESADPNLISEHLQAVLDFIGQGKLVGRDDQSNYSIMWSLKQEES